MTLAKKLLEYDVKCSFFVRNISKNLLNLLNETFEVVSLNGFDQNFNPKNQYERWLGVGQMFDANQFIFQTKQTDFQAVVVDHYGLDYKWELKVGEIFENIMVLDDLANREHQCKILVDQSIGRTAACYQTLVPEDCNLLLGPTFALLRDEFLRTSNCTKKKKFEILLNFGGADKDNYTAHVLSMIDAISNEDQYSIKIIIGKDYPFKKELIKKVKNSKNNIQLVENPENIAKEISECMISIGAGGVSLLERSALGIPSILYSIVENQVHICREYVNRDLGFWVHRDEATEKKKLKSAISTLLADQNLLNKSKLNMQFVDGGGVNRVVLNLINNFGLLNFYDGSFDDAGFVFECCYEPIESAIYVTSDIPSYENHTKWFSETLKNEKCKHIILKVGSVKCGYIRLDEHPHYIEVSISVHQIYRGRGFANMMLSKVCEWHFKNKLQATVHSQNSQSLRVFINNGFEIVTHDKKFLRLEKC